MAVVLGSGLRWVFLIRSRSPESLRSASRPSCCAIVRAEHPGILAAIRDNKEISKETGDKLKAAVDKFAKAFA